MQFRAIPAFALLACSLALTDASAQDARLVVSVVDYDNRALPGAHVIVYREELDEKLTLVANETTNEAGTIAIPVKPRQRYQLRASREGYEFPGEGNVHSAPPAGEVGITLRLRRIEPIRAPIASGRRLRYGVLTGQVLSARGEPLPNQSVIVTSTTRPGSTFGGSTSADGTFTFSVPPDRYTVRTGSAGTSAPLAFRSSPTYELFDPAVSPPVTVDSGATVPVNFWLQPAVLMFNLTVTVLDDSGQPARDAEVEAFGHRDPPTPNFVNADFLSMYQTHGKPVEFGPTMPGPVTVIARSIDRATPLAGIATIDLQGTPHTVTVLMQPAARLSGRIEFEGRDVPLQGPDGIRMTFQMAGSLLNLNSVASRLAAADGRFELTGLIGEGCLRVRGLPTGWRLNSITHDGADMTNRLIALEPGGIRSDVRVHIVPGEQPVGPPPDCWR